MCFERKTGYALRLSPVGADKCIRARNGSNGKSMKMGVFHAVSFGLGLMVTLLPVIAWWMGIGLVEALIVDIAFVVFYLVYAFVFTWCYDTVFPDNDASLS